MRLFRRRKADVSNTGPAERPASSQARRPATPPSAENGDLDEVAAKFREEDDRLATSPEFAAALDAETARVLAKVRKAEQRSLTASGGSESVGTRAGREADREAGALGYRDAAHQRDSERGKAARARRTTAEQIARATTVGSVSRAGYLTSGQEVEALKPRADGLLDARLERVRDRLLVVTPRGWVNPKSRTSYKAGLLSFQLRGTSHHAAAVRTGRFIPGASVRLVREPDNPHDANAVAVYADQARNKAGYVPAFQAKRLAPLLDDGADLVAVSVKGAGSSTEGSVPQILVCERRLFDHLTRPAV